MRYGEELVFRSSYVRAAYRGYKLPGYAGTDLGFRAVRTVGTAEVSQLK